MIDEHRFKRVFEHWKKIYLRMAGRIASTNYEKGYAQALSDVLRDFNEMINEKTK